MCNEIGTPAYKMQKENFKLNQRRLITMANREDNIKKINAELEKLDDDELEQVAGGAYLAMNRDEKEQDVNIANQRWMILDKIIHVR